MTVRHIFCFSLINKGNEDERVQYSADYKNILGAFIKNAHTRIYTHTHTLTQNEVERKGKSVMREGVWHSEREKLGLDGFRAEVTALEICLFIPLCVGSAVRTESQASLSNQMAADGPSTSASQRPLKIKGMKATVPTFQRRRAGQDSSGVGRLAPLKKTFIYIFIFFPFLSIFFFRFVCSSASADTHLCNRDLFLSLTIFSTKPLHRLHSGLSFWSCIIYFMQRETAPFSKTPY